MPSRAALRRKSTRPLFKKMLDQASNAPPRESRYHVLPWEDADLYASAPTSPHGMRTLLDTLERMPGHSRVVLSCAPPMLIRIRTSNDVISRTCPLARLNNIFRAPTLTARRDGHA